MGQLERLSVLPKQTAGKAVDLGNIHRTKVADLLQSSEGMLRAIVILYLAFVFVSGGLILLASIGFSRAVIGPLRKLSDAATEIAMGGACTSGSLSTP